MRWKLLQEMSQKIFFFVESFKLFNNTKDIVSENKMTLTHVSGWEINLALFAGPILLMVMHKVERIKNKNVHERKKTSNKIKF